MEKIYNKTQWENTPSTNTPINETNLNNIENGVDALDDRVVELSNTKSNVDWVQLQKSGDKIAEITIDGVKRTVYAKSGSGGGGGGTTDYEQLNNKPQINNVELSGNKSANDLNLQTKLATQTAYSSKGSGTKVPQITTNELGQVTNITEVEISGGGGGGGTSDYNALDNRPQINGVTLSGNKSTADLGIVIPTALNQLTDDVTHRLVTDSEKTAWNNKSDFDGNYNSLSNKPTIPSALSELTEDATHRTVTDEEKAKWNQGGGGSSSASDITYDNSTSGMEATNLQDATDELKQDLTQKVDKEWKFVGQTVGASNISLPQDFNELNIVLYISGLGNQKLQVSRNELTESDATYRQGWNYGGANQLIGISVSLTRVRLGLCYIDNVDKASQTTVKVWYR